MASSLGDFILAHRSADNGKKIAVTAEDLCPGCQKSSLDLSRGAFSKIANLDLGIIDVEWWFD